MMRAAVMDHRLEAIAGPPAGRLIGVGTVPVTGIDPMDDRTMYVCREWAGPPGNYTGFAWTGIEESRMTFRTESPEADPSRTSVRWDTTDGSVNVTRALSGTHVPGVRAFAAYTRLGLTRVGLETVGMTIPEALLVPGGGTRALTLTTIDRPGSLRPLVALLYAGTHDRATRVRVMSWLERFSLSLSLSLSL